MGRSEHKLRIVIEDKYSCWNRNSIPLFFEYIEAHVLLVTLYVVRNHVPSFGKIWREISDHQTLWNVVKIIEKITGG